MIRESARRINHGLAFYGTLAFVAGFFGARMFATPNPSVVVERSGVHFHHFGYGIAMVEVAGWLGIVKAPFDSAASHLVVLGHNEQVRRNSRLNTSQCSQR